MLNTFFICFSAILLIICIFDLFHAINLANRFLFTLYLFFAPHLPVIIYIAINSSLFSKDNHSIFTKIFFILSIVIFQMYTTLRLHFQSLRKNTTANSRVNIVYAGRNLIQTSILALYLLIIWYFTPFAYGYFDFLPNVSFEAGITFYIGELIYAAVFIFLFLLNGCLRIFFGSRNLVILKRLIILLFMWVPVVNLFLAHLLCEAAKDEYLVTVSREKQKVFTVTDHLCATKYPVIMVHGIGFRDLKYFNYWGRIPDLLKMHGCTVYYGHQNAWGTIEDNATALGKIVDQALSETGADKVNIIAHSKGGLDSRYLISSLGYADKVASLTTINTPHRGSELITILNKLPDSVYRFIANQLNKPFKLVGEKEPDCYSSSKQLDPVYCEVFNKSNPDKDGILYQSYTSIMHNLFSDGLLWFPYLLMCTQKGNQNDGLVDVSSAKWGEFKGILKSENNRGISHGDMIDLKREDINGFDVMKLFYDIVYELKERGL